MPAEIEIMIAGFITRDRVPKRTWSWLERTYLEKKLERDAKKTKGADRRDGVSSGGVRKFWAGVAMAPFIAFCLAGFWGLITGTISIFWTSLLAPVTVGFLIGYLL